MDSENKSLLHDLCWSKDRASPIPYSRKSKRAGPQPLEELSLVRPILETQRASSEQQRSKVGFPIRRFTDQSLFAAPHDLSQRTTSFIASQRQGIHQIPLRHLIALIAKARIVKPRGRMMRERKAQGFRPLIRLSSDVGCVFGVEKTSFASNASGDLSGQAPNPRLVALSENGRPRSENGKSVLRRLSSDVRQTECASSSQCQISEDRDQTTVDGSSNVGLSAFHRRAQKRPAKLIKLHRKDWRSAHRRSLPIPTSAVRKWWSQTGSNRRPHACKARALPTELWPRRRTDNRR